VAPTRPVARWARSAALCVGLVVCFGILEGGLWVGSLFRPAERQALGQELAPRPGERRILCIGDSFTYGVHLTAEQSYPGQLEAMLDLEPGQPWRVINLGYPGQNSAEVRLRLVRNIAAYRPEIVIAWIGANNTWSRAQSHLWNFPDSEPAPGFWQRAYQKSRAVGAIRMLVLRMRRGAAPGAAPEVVRDARSVPGLGGAQRGAGLGATELVVRDGKPEIPRDLVRRSISVDYRRMQQVCSQNGARLVIADYPVPGASTRKLINTALQQVGLDLGLIRVPLAENIVGLRKRLGPDTLWFSDQHCTAAGNYEVARIVLRTLMDAGLLEPRNSWRAIPSLVEKIDARGLALRERRGNVVEVEVSGHSLYHYKISLCAVRRHPGGEDVVTALPLARLNDSVEGRDTWYGRLDALGTASTTLRLPTPLSERDPGALLRGVLGQGPPLVAWRLVLEERKPEHDPGRVRALPGIDLALEYERE
jgi:hypothetical protein